MSHTPEELKRLDRTAVWHGFTQMAEHEPLVIERAQGCTLIDVDGRELIDGVSSLWCNVHGHCHPRIDAAIRDQLGRIAHCTSLGASCDTTVELAARLIEITPSGLEHVFFASDGSSAVEVALKMAFQYWQQRDSSQSDGPRPEKTKYLALGEAYHGDTIGGVSVGGMEQFHTLFRPLLFDVVRAPVPDTYRMPQGTTAETATGDYLAQLEKILIEHHAKIAAMVIEPLVQGAAGMVMHPAGYLSGVRELTRRYDVLLIADEVATGFGRTGTLFACEQEDVSPDILCLGKGITGGYLPMSATLGSDEIWSAFLGRYDEAKTFFHGHTYGGNPLAAAAALATLDLFEEEQTLAGLPTKIDRMAEHLGRFAEHPHVGSVRQRGMMVGIELVQDRETKTPYPWQERRGYRVCDHALTEGVWLRPLGNVVVLMPPLSITLEELDRVLLAAEAGIDIATNETT